MKVHKEVLVKKCPDFFLAIDWNNNVGIVSDLNYKTVKEFLRFAFYGKVENMKKVASDLLAFAKKHKISDLEKMCLEFLGNQ